MSSLFNIYIDVTYTGKIQKQSQKKEASADASISVLAQDGRNSI